MEGICRSFKCSKVSCCLARSNLRCRLTSLFVRYHFSFALLLQNQIILIASFFVVVHTDVVYAIPLFELPKLIPIARTSSGSTPLLSCTIILPRFLCLDQSYALDAKLKAQGRSRMNYKDRKGVQACTTEAQLRLPRISGQSNNEITSRRQKICRSPCLY